MKKSILLVLSVLLLIPALARAANAQAQEYDELGMSLYRQGLYAKAITYFQNAVQADPTDWEGYENLGNAYFKINDNADALTFLSKESSDQSEQQHPGKYRSKYAGEWRAGGR
jgi:tetratricopeptide (TPR) repeat protein